MNTVCGQSKQARPEDISCLKEGHVVHEALQATTEVWDKVWSQPLQTTDFFSVEDNFESDFGIDNNDMECNQPYVSCLLGC